MNRDERLLIVFSKNPVAGLVKTRLATSIGAAEALRVYEELRAITERATSAADCTRAVFYSDYIPEEDIFLDDATGAHLQDGTDLGERMHRAFLEGFRLGYRRVVLVGTDCPGLSVFLLDCAFEALEGDDAVIGPARDGGFYLIGLNRPIPELFLGRKWSTPEVLHESLSILSKQRAECAILPALSDIDTIDDLMESTLWEPS
ncbi:MAG: glycosyltransferase [Chlorobiaceae bacterium]|nr:glycosyltransferase [Chlorobiaceae bacterium]